ncbi:MAG: serine/threonine protein kinase [Pseudohongiellaceae bacterium]|jgi:serine/threonine protein kinase
MANEAQDADDVSDPSSRIETLDYQAEYPPMSGERAEYVRNVSDEGLPGQKAVHVGSIVDGYRVIRQIGRGGMGVVYEAEQLSLGRPVALKVMPPATMRNAKAADRFRREATAVARLHHPRIVAVHSFNTTAETAYLAMEFVDGLDLSDVVDRLKTAQLHGRRFVRVSGANLNLDITEWAQGRKLVGSKPGDAHLDDGIILDLRSDHEMMASFIENTADALRHAHAHGVIHRDIKPSNLILGPDGRIKLTDFGLAKSVDAVGTITASGDFLGSPAYVSPEQAATRRVLLDERSDIYSLGVTLYELLTLHQPFAGKNVAVVLRNIITKDPPVPTSLNPRIPKDLETIVLKAMEKDPDRRYQSAEEFGQDLRHFLNYEPITARPLGLVARSVRAVRRHRVAVALATMGVALATVLLLVALGQVGGGSHRLDATERLRRSLEGQERIDHRALGVIELIDLVAEDTSLDDAFTRQMRIESMVAQARRQLAAGQYGELFDLLATLDALTSLGDEADLDRLLPNNIRKVKIDLVRQLRNELAKSGLGPVAERKWLAALERLLMDDDWQVCQNAAVLLGDLAKPSTLGGLLDALVHRRDVEGREAIVRALSYFGGVAVLDTLTVCTRDPAWSIRYGALEALSRLAPDDLILRTAHLSVDPERWVQQRWSDERRAVAAPKDGGQ